MVLVNKNYGIKGTSAAKPGDLIRNDTSDELFFGIVIPPLNNGSDVIIIQQNAQQETGITFGYHTRFVDTTVNYGDAWQIKIIEQSYSFRETTSGLKVPGVIAVGEKDSSIFVGKGPVGEGHHILLSSLTMDLQHPTVTTHLAVTAWEIWLNSEADREGGVPLFEFELLS